VLCPRCNSSKVKKAGVKKYSIYFKSGKKVKSVQNYRCSNKHFFNNSAISRYTDSFIEHTVFTYLKCLSLNTTIFLIREQFEEEILSKKLILAFIEHVTDQLPTLDDIDRIYNPMRSKYLAFDGVWFKFRGISIVMLICFDPETFDVIDALWVKEEGYNGYFKLINQVLLKPQFLDNTKIKGVYAGGDKGFMKAKNELLPNTPFQLCTVHKELKMGKEIPIKSVSRSKQMTSKTKEEILKYQELFRECIYAKTEEESRKALKVLQDYSNDKSNKLTSTNKKRFQKTTRSLNYNFEYTLTHFNHTGMKKDNNMLECFNGYIKRRLRLMKNFKKVDNLQRYLNLFLIDYRFHPLKESRFKERRNLSPLEISGVIFEKPMYNFIKMLRKDLKLSYTGV